MFSRILLIILLITGHPAAAPAAPLAPEQIASRILAPLLDPRKVATLKGARPINPRFYKVLYWLESARANGGDVSVVSRGSKAENKWIFDRLYEQKEAIESEFDAPLEWLRLDNKKASGIRYRKEFDGYDPEHWPEMIEWLTKHVKRLEKTFGSRLKPMGQKLKAEFNSTGAFQEEVEG